MLSFRALSEKKTKVTLNPKLKDVMEKKGCSNCEDTCSKDCKCSCHDKEMSESTYDPMEDPDFDHDEAEATRGQSGKNKSITIKKKTKKTTKEETAYVSQEEVSEESNQSIAETETLLTFGQFCEDSRRMSNKQHTKRVRANIKAFGSNFTPPNNWDPDANRGQGEVVTRKQMEKKRRKALRKEEVEQYVDFLIDEGYDCSELTWEDMFEEYESLDEGLRSAVKRLLGKKEAPAEKKPESRGEQLRKKYNVGPEKSDTSAKRQILDRTRAKKERDQKEYGGSHYSKSVAKKSADAHDRYLRAGYSKYGADDRRGSGNKARKRAEALKKEDLEMTGLFLDWEIDTILEVFNEGVRDTDPEKGTAERKERLEKKRGMKLDDHPQYKKEETEYVDENRRAARAAGGSKDDSKKQPDPSKDGFTGIGNMSIDQIRKMSARIEKEKTKKEEVEHVEEGMKAARDNVGASTCWDGYEAKGTKNKGGKEVPNCVKKEETSWATRSKVEFSKPEVVEEEGISEEQIQEIAPAIAAAGMALKGAAMRVAASQTARMAAKQVGKAAVKGAANKMSKKLNPEEEA